MSRRPEPKSTRGVDLGNLADVPPADDAGSGPRQVTTVDVGEEAAALLRGFRLHVLRHGPIEDMTAFDQFIIRATRELTEDLEQRYNNGAQFPVPQSRLPKGSRAGTLGPEDELVRFSAKVPTSLMGRKRGALLYLALNDAAREAEQIGMAPEYNTRSILRLGRNLEHSHQITLSEQ